MNGGMEIIQELVNIAFFVSAGIVVFIVAIEVYLHFTGKKDRK
jgi:uncharacterized membrane protein YjfL (UPF0719 family)